MDICENRFKVDVMEEILKYIVFKGSITIDGVSLTVAYINDKVFKVSIIPHTAEETVLLKRHIGDFVNLECDLIGKYVEKLLGFKKEDEKKDISKNFLKVSPEAINFMVKFGRGLICMPIKESLANRLEINPMVLNNTDNHGIAFTVSIDHIDTKTGISAFERAYTIQKVLDKESKGNDFRRPGHVFPLIAKEGGVLKRIGHTEEKRKIY